MPKVKAWEKILDLNNYINSDKSVIQLINDRTKEKYGDQTEIPIPIMYRLYYLGRAYDLQTMKLFRPNGKIILDWIHLQKILNELNLINNITNDPIIQYFSGVLLSQFGTTKNATNISLVIVSPETYRY